MVPAQQQHKSLFLPLDKVLQTFKAPLRLLCAYLPGLPLSSLPWRRGCFSKQQSLALLLRSWAKVLFQAELFPKPLSSPSSSMPTAEGLVDQTAGR